jgi:ubiquinone/menaquinone biosynthesis C-methylase UbiE
MVYHLRHEMLARLDEDQAARQRFVLALKRHLMSHVRTGTGVAYAQDGEPAFEAKHGRKPQTRGEALEALGMTRHFQAWCALNRSSQEMMWQSVAEAIYRDTERMSAAAERLTSDPAKKGSLTLDPGFAPDPIYRDVHVHLQPLSYLAEDKDGKDVLAGAFYEMGGRLYSMGRGMAGEDSKAGAVIKMLDETRPGWRPRRVLDMGCSAGGGTVPYAEAWPDAEVYGIDLGSSMLRYAHARAESLGHRVHFVQGDASATTFPDGHFDLIISHNLFHEISTETRQRLAGETLRLLAPGGIAVHQDVDILYRGYSLWQEAERAYDLYWNGEPFWVDYAECDFIAELVEAGFPREAVRETRLKKLAGPGYWYAFIAEKAPATVTA